jgi:P27 family predicted phage terminase small subunit
LPPRKPRALVAVEGQRGHRTKAELAKYASEPRPRPLAPDCPTWLPDLARQRWQELAPRLEDLGVLTEVDGDFLAIYCLAYAQFVELTAYLAEHGDTLVIVKSGYEAPRPEVAMLHYALETMRRFGAEFGIGGAARTRIGVTPAPSGPLSPLERVQQMTRRD